MSLETIGELVRDYGYWMVLFGTYFDHYGIPLFLVFGSMAAADHLLNVYVVLICGFAGGWIADLFLYFLGYKTGLQYWMQFALVKKLAGPIESIHRLFRSRPAMAVILGRFLFAVSKFIPPFAGMIRYPVRTYVLYSFIGNILFSITYTAAGFLAGRLVLESLKELKVINILLTVLFILILMWLTQKLLKKPSHP